MNDVMKCSCLFYLILRFASVLMLYLDVGSIFLSLVSFKFKANRAIMFLDITKFRCSQFYHDLIVS